MDGVVGDADFFGAGFLAEKNDGFKNVRMRGRAQIRGSGPGEVGLDYHHITFGNEPGHAAGGFKEFPGQSPDVTGDLFAGSFCNKPVSRFCGDSRERRRDQAVKDGAAGQADELSSIDELGVFVHFDTSLRMVIPEVLIFVKH